ncbi:MAG TPA: SH3 domain-containing protein [Pseudomonadales bacterium]|nr:SH3 domain-containing protein [Pseudomonadales bacterium]
MKRLLFILSAVLICATTLLASDATANFSSANQLYDEGKFSQAAKSYETMLNAGVVSPNLLFNTGNAEIKSGNLGRAIAAYRRAELLAPRDVDVRANLNFARNQVQGGAFSGSHWDAMLGALTLNEWTVLAAMAFWLTFGLFAAMQIRPALKNILQGPARGLAVLTVLLCLCLGVAANTHFSKQIAVVVSPDAVTRSGPFSDAQNAFAVHDGAELAVLDRRNNWVQVADNSGRSGWIQDGQVEVLPAI